MKQKDTTSSLIITAYNWPEALELVLHSVLNQKVLPTEVLIADDGSKNETEELIKVFQDLFPIPLIHVWHEDKGFRLAVIRNKAICKAKGDYIIQIDGDTILHQSFVKDHLQMAKPDTFITGSRVLLNQEVSEEIQRSKKISFNWTSEGITNRFNSMYLPYISSFFSQTTLNVSEAIAVRGCNMSFWKKDLIKVNGFDEEMTGWGREDSEISVRLVHNQIKKERIKFGAIQYHLYHPISSRTGLNKNNEILEETIQTKKKRCHNGLSNHCLEDHF